MDQVKIETISFQIIKGCLPQILLGLFLNTLPHMPDRVLNTPLTVSQSGCNSSFLPERSKTDQTLIAMINVAYEI